MLSGLDLALRLEDVAKPDPCPHDAKDIKPAKPHDLLPAVLGNAKVLLADMKVKDL
jgi:hypothetical protein